MRLFARSYGVLSSPPVQVYSPELLDAQLQVGRSATSAPGLGSPLPRLRWDWAHPRHICAGTGPAPARICTGSRPSSAPHVRRDWAVPLLYLLRWPLPHVAVVVVAMHVARPSRCMARGVSHSFRVICRTAGPVPCHAGPVPCPQWPSAMPCGSCAGRQAQAEAYTRASSAVDFGASTIVLPKLYKWHVRAAAVFSQLAARTHGPTKSVAARSRLRIIVLRVRISG